MSITESRQINLSSSSATVKNNTMNSVLLFRLPGLLKKDKNILYNVISLVHAQIPLSYYLINSTNNIINISGTNYILNSGNYNANSFKTMLLLKLGAGWTLTLSSTTGCFTLGYTSSFSFNSTSTCNIFFGALASTTYTSTSNFIIFPYPCNFLGVNRIKIKSMVLSTNNIDSGNGSSSSNLLTTIPVNNASGGLLVYQNLSNLKNIIHNTDINEIDISLTNEIDQILDFNNCPIYVTIQIDTIRTHIVNNETLLELLDKQ